jgi:hypothetical protein
VLDEYVSELVRVLQTRLGDRLVAVWQVGSSALGGFDPATSDVDVQAVAAPLSRPELEALASELSAVPCPVRGLEFVLYAEPPAFQLNLNTGPGMDHHEGYDPAAEPRFWFVLDLAIARGHARPLVGPHPRELVSELPVREALIESLVWWRDYGGPQASAAAARTWAYLETGRWLSKREAAIWLVDRVLERAVQGGP